MSDPTTLILAVLGIVFGLFVLVIGTQAMLFQDRFLRLYNAWQKTARFGIKPFDLDYFGGATKLRFLGIALIAIGLFILASIMHISGSRLW